MRNASIASRIMQKVAKAAVATTLAIAMGLGAGVQAFAADSDYTYTVRLYAGAQGSFEGGKKCFEWTNLEPGAQVIFNQGNVKVPADSKYYVRGWKESGRDNSTSSELLAVVTVNSDMDLVVSYGIKGDDVAYTVRYIDQNGVELAPSETFYGNVGDSPMLAYRYVDGYQPQAYNLTGELYADASQNVYTFRYTPVDVPEDVVIVNPATIYDYPAGEPEAGGGAAAEAPAAAAEDAPATAVEAPAAEEPVADDGTPLAGPAAIQNIRDDETPLASSNNRLVSDAPAEGSTGAVNPVLVGIGLGSAALIFLAAGLALIILQRRKQQEAAAQAAIAYNYDAVYPTTTDQPGLVDASQQTYDQSSIDVLPSYGAQSFDQGTGVQAYDPMMGTQAYDPSTGMTADPSAFGQQMSAQPFDGQGYQATYGDVAMTYGDPYSEPFDAQGVEPEHPDSPSDGQV